MNVARPSKTICKGDIVIIHQNSQSMQAIKVETKLENKHGKMVDYCHQTRYGSFRVASLIGKKYGSVLELKSGFVNLLHPSPELWTLSLPHRTQILYSADISLAIFNLELRPGSVVCEAGTGSGSMSHSILRTIAPNGKLHTFDFHHKRVETARKEFREHGFDEDIVSISHRDVCSDGFGLEGTVDAVFLDLPKPWEAVIHTPKAFKSTGGRLCSFSPCIEQVQRTCQSLKSLGFWEIRTVECLLREFLLRRMKLPIIEPILYEKPEGDEPKKRKKFVYGKEMEEFRTALPAVKAAGHTGYLTFATFPPCDDVMTSGVDATLDEGNVNT